MIVRGSLCSINQLQQWWIVVLVDNCIYVGMLFSQWRRTISNGYRVILQTTSYFMRTDVFNLITHSYSILVDKAAK